MTLSKLIESEVSDFFASLGGPGEPDIQSGEAQQQLTIRLLSLLERRERDKQEPIVTDSMALVFHHAITDGCAGSDDIEEIKAGLRAALSNYAAPPAPVTLTEDQRKLLRKMDDEIVADLEKEERACRAAMLTAEPQQGAE